MKDIKRIYWGDSFLDILIYMISLNLNKLLTINLVVLLELVQETLKRKQFECFKYNLFTFVPILRNLCIHFIFKLID